jgi:hypothetical protein
VSLAALRSHDVVRCARIFSLFYMLFMRRRSTVPACFVDTFVITDLHPNIASEILKIAICIMLSLARAYGSTSVGV